MRYLGALEFLHYLGHHNKYGQPLPADHWKTALYNARELLNSAALPIPYPVFLTAILTRLVGQIRLCGPAWGYHKGDITFQCFLYGELPAHSGWFDLSTASINDYTPELLMETSDILAELGAKLPWEWYKSARNSASSFFPAQCELIERNLAILSGIEPRKQMEVNDSEPMLVIGKLKHTEAVVDTKGAAPSMHAPQSAGFVCLTARKGTGRGSPPGFP